MIDLVGVFCSSSTSCVWPPNFSQFVPDIMVALITGVAIGFALDRVQIRRFKRDQKKDAQVAWDRLRSSLRNFFETHLQAQADHWIDKETIDGITERIGDHPIQQWNRLLRDEALSSLVRFERRSSTLVHSAGRLDEALRPTVIAKRPESVSKSNLSERVREVERAVRAIELGIDPSTVRVLSQQNLPEHDLQEWVKSVTGDEDLRQFLEQFRAARAATMKEFESTARVLAAEGFEE